MEISMDERIDTLFSELSDMNVETSKITSETWRLVAECEQQLRHKVQVGYEDAAAHGCRALIGERVARQTAVEESGGNTDDADRWRIVLSAIEGPKHLPPPKD
jgi:tRNA U54 and U55 pseudouridine synthase Pus10